jgi:EAL domain-containing protein (putative c-di-GMP-specific phosphodiesterase class I)/CHASE2 domain-containing sensor protein
VCAVDRTEQKPSERRPWRTLLWIAIAGLIFGVLGLGEIGEDVLRTGRNSLHWHKASGEIVVVKIDEASLRAVGRWPWPRRYYAELIDRLSAAGARRIFVDLQFTSPSNPVDDALLANSIRNSGRVVLGVAGRIGPNNASDPDESRLPIFRNDAKLGSIAVNYNWQNAIWRVAYRSHVDNIELPSFSAALAGKSSRSGTFLLDYSIDPSSVPTFGAESVLSGRIGKDAVRGRDVLIGATASAAGDRYFIPGMGKMGGVYVHAIGAETLKSGNPIGLGWIPLFLASLAVAAVVLLRKTERHQVLILGFSFVAVFLGPAALETRLIFLDVTPALFVLVATGGVVTRHRFKTRGLIDAASGLPNLAALRANRRGRDMALIVGRVLNYAEVVATLPTSSERQLVEQIVGRLSVGAQGRTFYQGDDGIFAWFDEPGKPFGHHLEALHALFRTPLRVSGLSIDLSVSFGVEIGSSRSLANRLGSALLAAEQAAHDGLKWKYHDPDTLQDASWKLSMLSQLDDAIDRGEVWAAYQPKVDLRTRKIIGAEALARWTHPEKGPIAASEFVAAAEQNDRIGKLTAFMLDEAIEAAATLNRGGRDFDMSVNLSGRLLGDKAFVGRIAILLERHGVDPRHLTLELTETAAIAGSGEALEMLTQLRELGLNISIDDYGTGLSTLDYLKRIPATEIKIDQTFVRAMAENRSERLMVSSTIGLAHSLGRTIVAEGVETREVLELLAEMECDVAQGFITGRPMSLESLKRRLASERRIKAA